MALPAIVVILGAAIWGLGVAGLQGRCVAAARSAALASARGESEAAVAGRVARALGPGAALALTKEGREVAARVSVTHAGLRLLPARLVSATAYAEIEPVEATG